MTKAPQNFHLSTDKNLTGFQKNGIILNVKQWNSSFHKKSESCLIEKSGIYQSQEKNKDDNQG